jgi:hypothetical protein
MAGKDGWGSTVVLLLMIFLGTVGYNHWDAWTKPAVKPVVASVPNSATKSVPRFLVDPEARLDLSDLKMFKSSAFPVSGDLRPLWTTTGRIKNNTTFTLKEVRLQIHINNPRGDEADSAQLVVKTPIPPMGTISFEQNIQVLPPTKWEWTCNIVQAVIDSDQ